MALPEKIVVILKTCKGQSKHPSLFCHHAGDKEGKFLNVDTRQSRPDNNFTLRMRSNLKQA
jgi:hypothetical protein